MSFVVENIRLRELALVTEQNRPAFDDFVNFLASEGYPTLYSFVCCVDPQRAHSVILKYLRRPFPIGVALYDGIARPYEPGKAKWLLLGWIFRDAPEQRLRPMVASMEGNSVLERQALLLNQLRIHVAQIFPTANKWGWEAISEVIIDRLEGSRRAIKGTLFEAIVRTSLQTIFANARLPLQIDPTEIRLGGETYDVSVVGKKGRILIPVKTRETMGGGHALLFTRDIHKSIDVAQQAGFDCLPVIIAESWAGNLSTLKCADFIYINMNPNQIALVSPIVAAELAKRVGAFTSIA